MPRHIISATDLSSEELGQLFRAAEQFDSLRLPSRSIVATLFYEPSTRTRLSFEVAISRLGGGYVSTENAEIFSSAAKGESLEDTIRVVSDYVDIIVLRHKEAGSAARAAEVASVPIINAGDGPNEHPTQAFLDLYTIWKWKQRRMPVGPLPFEILFFGDNATSRTVRSLVRLLALRGRDLDLHVERIHFVGPDPLGVPPLDVVQDLEQAGIETVVSNTVPRGVHVVYVTRSQKEKRNGNGDEPEIMVFEPRYLERLHADGRILHPLPRTQELPKEIDVDPRAHYFEQAKNGLHIRMALLHWLLTKPD